MYALTRPLQTIRRRGIGDATYSQEVATGASIAQSGAATTAALLVEAGAVTGPVGALIGAAAAALISVGSLIANEFQGCGQTCVVASNDANKFGDLLKQNLDAYVSAPFNASLQAAALNNFDTVWAALSQACSDPSLGSAGQRCISDRQRGACTWKASPGGWNPDGSGSYTWQDWGPAGSGSGCWNYFVGFRDPITNDPRSSGAGAIAGSIGSFLNALPISPLWIGVILIGAGLAFSGRGDS